MPHQTPAEVDKWSISFGTRNEKDNIEGQEKRYGKWPLKRYDSINETIKKDEKGPFYHFVLFLPYQFNIRVNYRLISFLFIVSTIFLYRF